jgi:hypothetical protein
MIIKLNENRFNRFFLFESANSKRAHKQTRAIIAGVLGRAVDDPMVIESEQAFEKMMFGEGLRQDWFIILEPCAAKWVYIQGASAGNVKSALGYLATKAASVPDNPEFRPKFIQQIMSIEDFDDLRLFIKKCEKEDREIARKNGGEKPVLNKNYYVVGPLSFEDSKQYGDKSGGNGVSCRICYTQYPNTWLSSSYSDKNTNELFILLRKDWEKWNNVVGEIQHDGSETSNGLGDPYDKLNGYDDYGLSMVFVWINPDGEIHETNTRWNHGGNFISPDVDKAFTEAGIRKLMGGATLKEIFNVNTIYEKLDAVEERLANGEDPHDIFNIIFEWVRDINNSFLFPVKYGDKYNLIEKNSHGYSLVFKDYWPDYVGVSPLNKIGDIYCRFGDRIYIYTVENQLMPINRYLSALQERIQNGESLNNLFGYLEPISGNYEVVGFNTAIGGNKIECYNIITKDGNFLSNKWEKSFDYYGNSTGNILIFGNKENVIKEDGTLLFDVPFNEWYEDIIYENFNDIYCVKKSGNGCTILRKDLTPLNGVWYKSIFDIINIEGFCGVKFDDNHYGYLNLHDGNTLGEGMGIKECYKFGETFKGGGVVRVDGTERRFILTRNNELVDFGEYTKKFNDEIFLRLANGEKIEDLFSVYKTIGENVFVKIGEKWNMINKEKNGFFYQFNFCYEPMKLFSSDIALVTVALDEHRYDYRYNFILPNGEPLFNFDVSDWPYEYERLYNGEGYILGGEKDGKHYKNIISANGLAFNGPMKDWPDSVYNTAYEGHFCMFRKGNKINYIDFNTGELVWKKPIKYWFDREYNMSGPYFSVTIGNKNNVLSLYGGLMWKKPLNEWFDDVYNADYVKGNNLFCVRRGGKNNILKCDRTRGKLLFEYWVDSSAKNGLNDGYTVRRDNKFNVYDKKTGKPLFKGSPETWPDMLCAMNNMAAYIFSINGKCNIISPSGKLLWKKPYEEWFDRISNRQENGYIRVIKGEKSNILGTNGKLAFEDWYDYVCTPSQGLCSVTEKVGKKFKTNLLNKKGVPISKMWFDTISKFTPIGLCYVMKNRRYNMMNKKGELLLKLPIKDWPTSNIYAERSNGKVYLTAQYNKLYYITRSGKLSETPVAYCKYNRD